ncbi:ATP-binding protein [Spongiactinospora gelatinilytica]|nr:ATP-binding protein [Spongiactinospora gelatinilytica]
MRQLLADTLSSAIWKVSTFPGTLDQVAAARRTIREMWAANPSLNGDFLDDLLLMVSELTANAIRHTRSGDPGGLVGLVVTAHSTGVRVEVIDQGSRTVPRVIGPEDDDMPLRRGGRGLALVEATSDRWGHHPVSMVTARRGRVVWFEKGTA